MAFIGSAFGAEVGSDTDFVRYWCESLCSTVRFDRAVVAAQKCGADAVHRDVGAPSLLYPLVELIGDDSAVIVGRVTVTGRSPMCCRPNIAAAAIADPALPMGRCVARGDPAAAARIPECPDAGGAPVGRTANRVTTTVTGSSDA